MEKLWRIEELTTEGWTLLDDKAVKPVSYTHLTLPTTPYV